MDNLANPFSPGAGSPPPELVGRDSLLNQANILFGRVKNKKSEKSILLTGLRGVGKTVLLIEIEQMAKQQGYHTIYLEAYENKELGQMLIPPLRKLLFHFDRIAGVSHKVKRGMAVLRSFISSLKVSVKDFSFGIDINPEKGVADTGDIEIDLTELFVVIGEAAEDRKSYVAIFIDEIQYLSHKELSALIMAMHRIQQKQLPIVLISAGLPILPSLAGESKSYAERLFSFPIVGALSEEDASKALQDPAEKTGVNFDVNALKEIYRLTEGYPYFIQEWGYQSWNFAPSSPITLKVVKEATNEVIKRLDENFFRVRFDRLAPSEKSFLRAMAELKSGTKRTSDIAQLLGVKNSSLGPLRAKLIKKGMIYSPSHGDIEFTVPLFDEFMRRAIPTL